MTTEKMGQNNSNKESLNKNNSNKTLKITAIILAILLLGSIGYTGKLLLDLKDVQTELATTKTDKDTVIADLEALKTTYDLAIAENTELSDELKAEREKVVELLEEVKTAKHNLATMQNYKKRYQDLESKMNALIQENDRLKIENQQLAVAIDSTTMMLVEEKEYTQTLSIQNEELSRIVDEASKLSINNLKAGVYKVKKSGKEIATDKAKKADILKVDFTISENKIAKKGTRIYYTQVVDAKKNVLGEKQTISFGNENLTYSFAAKVDYDKSSLNVSEKLKGENFQKGLYHVHIYEGNQLMASKSFTLK